MHLKRALAVLVAFGSLILHVFSSPDEETDERNRHRILTMKIANPSTYASQVFLQACGKQKCTSCGGTLMRSVQNRENRGHQGFYVVTAAHCIHDPRLIGSISAKEVIVYITPNNWSNPQTMGVQVTAKRALIHTKYLEPASHRYDIAVVDLGANVQLKPGTKPAILPTEDQDLKSGSIVTFVGYGVYEEGSNRASFVPRLTKLAILDEKGCSDWHQTMEPPYVRCAVVPYPAGRPMAGDSGSGVTGKYGNDEVLLGVQFAVDPRKAAELYRVGFISANKIRHWIEGALEALDEIPEGVISTVDDARAHPGTDF